MHKETEENLKAAFAGESQAHMKYKIFAERAEKEGFAHVARLLRAASFAEEAHATSHLRTLGGIGKTAENLAGAIAGETYEFQEMYPSFLAVAEDQEEKSAVRTINYALDAEKVHAALYARAREAVLSGKDVEMGTIHICEVCGYTVEGEAPDRCPLCNAPKDKFHAF